MNDNFLKNYKKQPRPEFARSLHMKLKQGETMKTFKPILRFAMLMLLVAFALIAAVPAARAQAAEAFEVVFISFVALPQNSDQPTVLFLEDDKLMPSETVPLAEAREQVDYSLLLPTWAPEGYVLAEDEVTMVSLKDEVVGLNIRWDHEQGVITLMVNPADENGLVRPEGGEVTELEVNGNPGFLMSNELSISAVPMTDGTPGPDIVIDQTLPIVSLSWIQDGVQYNLSGSVSKEDILRMAESLQ